MNQRSIDLLAVGECMLELHAQESLGTAPMLQKSYGGDVLNSLVTASRLGCRTAFVSRVGNDPFGQALQAAWQQEGIDTTHAPLVAGENGVYFISVDAHGEREFTYRRAGSAASQLEPQDLETVPFASSRMLLISGITQAISESARAATLVAAQHAQQAGVLVAYDPNHRPNLWARFGGLPAAREAFDEIKTLVDIFLISNPADLPVLGETSLEVLAVKALVAVKNGAAGAKLMQHKQHWEIPPYPAEVLDSTGAGDAWNGAFLAGLLKRQSPLQAAQNANRVAAAKLAFRGAIAPKGNLAALKPELL